MRRPARKALLWFLLAACGALGVSAVAQFFDRLGEIWSLALGAPAAAAIPFGIVYGIMAVLSAIGEARLRRGIGVIARWSVSPAAWEAFRAYDAMRGAEGRGLRNDYTPRPAAGRAVEVVFGVGKGMVDGSYHPLRRWAIPQLTWVGWQQPPVAPECLEFGLLYPAGRSSTVPMTLRVPVPPEARDDGVRVFHHFAARVPAPRAGLAFRRPWLVIGWGLGVAAAALALAGIGWLMKSDGDASVVAPVLLISGILSAGGALLFTAIIVLVTRPWRKQPEQDGR
jgi:hypothetical protein